MTGAAGRRRKSIWRMLPGPIERGLSTRRDYIHYRLGYYDTPLISSAPDAESNKLQALCDSVRK